MRGFRYSMDLEYVYILSEGTPLVHQFLLVLMLMYEIFSIVWSVNVQQRISPKMAHFAAPNALE